ncbi:MAG: SDR family NAD(P)-dependent oxidoreductase [Chloroflexota bacterium]
MGDFTDKVVLVTGAGKGTGRAIAEAFAARGALVAANDVTPINLDETVAGITASGGRVRAYVEDVAKKMPVQTLVNAVQDEWGRIDILVNCAEVEPRASLLEMDDWDWQRTLDVNLTGTCLLLQTVGRVMRAQGGGVMVNLGARAKAPDRVGAAQKRAAYLASKAGLVALTEQAAGELAADNIRVYLVAPGKGENVVEKVISLAEAGCPSRRR